MNPNRHPGKAKQLPERISRQLFVNQRFQPITLEALKKQVGPCEFAWILPQENPDAPNGAFVYTGGQKSDGHRAATVFVAVGEENKKLESFEEVLEDFDSRLKKLKQGSRDVDESEVGTVQEEFNTKVMAAAYRKLVALAREVKGDAGDEIKRLLDEVTKAHKDAEEQFEHQNVSAYEGPMIVPHVVYNLVNGLDDMEHDIKSDLPDPEMTPLRCAVQANNIQVIKILIEQGADLRKTYSKPTDSADIDLSFRAPQAEPYTLMDIAAAQGHHDIVHSHQPTRELKLGTARRHLRVAICAPHPPAPPPALAAAHGHLLHLSPGADSLPGVLEVHRCEDVLLRRPRPRRIIP